MFHVLAVDSIKEEGLQPLLEMTEAQVHMGRIEDDAVDLSKVEALLVRSATSVDADLLDSMPSLKIVARAGVGVDNIDITEATKRGIVVVNAPDGNTISTAEHTFAMMASLMRNIPQAHSSVKSGEWKRNQFIGNELFGKILGIIGMGRIGSELAKRARVFGMAVKVFDPFLTKERAEVLGVQLSTFEEVLSEADIITVHTPLTKETKGLLNEKTLSQTKKGVYLLNCARGGIIDEAALAHFIEKGHVAGAALDVFVSEPPGDSPLLQLDSVIVTPHLGASTKEAQLNVATQVAQEVRTFFENKPVANSINLPAMSKELYEKIQPFHQLAKEMGKIVSECHNKGVNELTVTYSGTAAELETSFLTKALLAGFFDNRIDKKVNEVNAIHIAKERGIMVGEKVTGNSYGYANTLTVTARGDGESFTARGTYIDHYGPRIVNLDGFNIDFHPSGNLLYIQHMDRPGVIGHVGKILGDHGVNIATMQVGRKEAGGEAIMVLSFDKPLEEKMIEKLEALQDIVTINGFTL
ncbi:phosphoglycerate dehydrogenase [Mesobacillus subterraneus]|uniref:D-3-phosphoglycerate dehydrogenase n=1 Tax=Mesobacillus subterraneus TaxID=285983 RepID=A0A427TQ21_9BACI|nr:phosphoglycerate dehydrogenase [Mesobacillus subterraneus]RSD26458.1 phosphoglycerate dehydrogenase [Mesobacillus subterraneus]